MSIYITSDLHFCHNKPFLYEPRGFKTIGEMNQAIAKNWNNIVDTNDDVYVLGDLMLNDNDEGTRLIKQLKGRIHIVLGNHDTSTREEIYSKCYNVVSVNMGENLEYNGYHFFLSHYPTICENHDVNKPLNRRRINLCGHMHTQDRWASWSHGLIYHCELDAHNNTPVLLDNIITEITNKI